MSAPVFEVHFVPGAYRDYEALDGSVVEMVDRKLEELEHRAHEMGKPLRNAGQARLAGCREIKLRDAGIRIVYRIAEDKVDILRIVYVLAIEKRADDYVFQVAARRLAQYGQMPSDEVPVHLNKKPARRKQIEDKG